MFEVRTAAAQRALTAATLSLVVALACIAAFLPPMAEQTIASVPRTVLIGLALGSALLLHWVFLGIGARRLGRSVVGWVGLSALLFPIGSVTALVLLGFFSDESPAAAPMPGR